MKRHNKKTQAHPSPKPNEFFDTSASAKADAHQDRIRRRAHQIHEERGGGSGRELDDWLQAESEMNAELDRQA